MRSKRQLTVLPLTYQSLNGVGQSLSNSCVDSFIHRSLLRIGFCSLLLWLTGRTLGRRRGSRLGAAGNAGSSARVPSAGGVRGVMLAMQALHVRRSRLRLHCCWCLL